MKGNKMSYAKMMKMQKPNRGPKKGGNYMGFDAGTIRPVCHKSKGMMAYQDVSHIFKYRHMDGLDRAIKNIKQIMPIAKAWARGSI